MPACRQTGLWQMPMKQIVTCNIQPMTGNVRKHRNTLSKGLIIVKVYLLILTQPVISQVYSTIFGLVTDSQFQPVNAVNISVSEANYGTSTNQNGLYELQIPANTKLTIIFSSVGYMTKEITLNTQPGEKKELNVILETFIDELQEVKITERANRRSGFTPLKMKDFKIFPNISGNIESLLKTFPGVSSSNELSYQYSVRGGNFDENLIYVNDIEVYRPFLIRSGQQEGLSFINPDMVSSIRFSAGGFDASFGDKMSSVLDIKYHRPDKSGGTISMSLLGGSAHIEGISKNSRFTHITGLRYKTNQYILNSLETRGDYKPVFTDLQTYLTYSLSEHWETEFLGNFAMNKYYFVPENRETSFGTVSDAVQIYIIYDGKEQDKFTTYFGALSAKYHSHKNLSLKFIVSAFNTSEEETFDIQGRYSLNELDKEFGSENLGDSIMNIGIGRFLNHARNYLNATVLAAASKGVWFQGNHHLKWGIKLQQETIHDDLNEWKLIDSAGFSIPYSDTQVNLAEQIKPPEINLQSARITAYIQDSYRFMTGNTNFEISGGLRTHFWNFNRQFLISPRVSLTLYPNWKKLVIFHAACGLYNQPPFYKELKDQHGNINYQIKAQESIHFTMGSEYNFYSVGRPFKFITEVYYKKLNQLIPYKIDNVRINYSGKNMAKGYAVGMDMKINGEFVPGAESWISLSLMQTKEDIVNDFYYNDENIKIEPGYYPRPTDQLINFGLFFQDYIPKNPSYKVHLTALYGTGFPSSSPFSERYDNYFRIPSYRRVDIGISKEIIGISNPEAGPNPKGFMPKASIRKKPLGFGLESLSIGLEIFNLLDINNTISYLWLTTVNNLSLQINQYAIPNYLTSRRLNVKVSVKF
jgi:hypothetical protein